MGRATFTLMDYGRETSTVGVYIPDLVAGNITAIQGLVDDLLVAGQAVSGGTLILDARVATVARFTKVLPTDENIQRERKWRIIASDDVTGLSVGFEWPTALPAGFLAGNTDFMDLTSTEGAAFVAAIEAVVKSNIGNAITVEAIEYVGRNL